MKIIALPSLCLLLPTLGAQTFEVVSQRFTTAPIWQGRIDIGDFNGDGPPDLVYSGLSPTSFMLMGSPDGVFGAPLNLPVSLGGSWVQFADTNGDGRSDLWRCDGNGCTRLEQGATGFVVTASLGQARSMTCADFNEDGHIDIVLGADTGLALARGDGLGGFLPAVAFAPPSSMGYIHCVTVDLNGDRHWDLVVADFAVGVKVFLGNGAGSFTGYTTSVPSSPRTRLADVNGDRRPDLINGSTYSYPTMAVRLNNGLGHFGTAQVLPGLNAYELAAADFDGDGIVDLVGLTGTGMWIALGLGGGQFAAPTSFPMGGLWGLVVSDIDGDGSVEALALDSLYVQVLRLVVPRPQGVRVFGNGSPTCAGTIGIRGTVEPILGDAPFRVQCTNVPRDSFGLLAGGTPIMDGWQPLGLGLQFHLLTAWPLSSMNSDSGGTASCELLLPTDPIFSGLTVYLQSFWFADASRGNTCSPALYDLASSRGLGVTLH